MGAKSNTKGDRRERELVNLLHASGWAVMRAPASGSATERELPDVLVGNSERFYALEAKASERSRAIYIEAHEIDGLRYFAKNFGAEPRAAIRYDYEDWAFPRIKDLHRTPSGKNYRIRHQDIQDRQYDTIHDL